MTLPDGARGRALAAGITLVVVAALWVGVVGPAFRWYGDREDMLADRLRLLARMEALAATVPALRGAAAHAQDAAPPPGLLTEGNAALAGASLQERVQKLADATGVRLASAEALPPEPTGPLERIGLRLSLAAPFPAAMAMLRGLADGTPPVVVDDLRLQPAFALGAVGGIPGFTPGLAAGGNVEVGLTVSAFRAPGPPPRRP